MVAEYYITNGTHEWGPYDEEFLRGQHAKQAITDDTLLQHARGGTRRTYRDFFMLKVVEPLPPPKAISPPPPLSIGRFTFLSSLLFLNVIYWLTWDLINWQWYVAAFAITATIHACRLRDIGLSGWWSLLIAVPVLGSAPIFGLCLLAPTGFAHTGRLDSATQVAKWIYGLALAVTFIPMLSGTLNSPAAMMPVFLLYALIYAWIPISFYMAVSLVRRDLKS